MPSTTHSIFVILLIAGITFLLRFIPFALFGGKRGMPPMIEYLGKYLPPTIMAILIVYCLKSVSLTTAPHGLPEFLSVAVVTALHLWKRNFLISIAGGTICYMVLIQNIFL
ncbi:MAG: AzlD domain-containing protein [Butyricicoccus sp.]|nr:AzlD domain-containing protein [Butyricicoccus sp.]